jgi:hypothetical protein
MMKLKIQLLVVAVRESVLALSRTNVCALTERHTLAAPTKREDFCVHCYFLSSIGALLVLPAGSSHGIGPHVKP